jgi:hypothetical protein
LETIIYCARPMPLVLTSILLHKFSFSRQKIGKILEFFLLKIQFFKSHLLENLAKFTISRNLIITTLGLGP